MNTKKHTTLTKHIKHTKLTKHIILAFFALTLLVTQKTTKTALPEIQGLYEIFTPDVIGIGQALKIKGWIENVYDFAPDDNLAQKVVKEFWHKVSENEPLAPTKRGPVAAITPEILGKILNYIREFKANNEQVKSGITKIWSQACVKTEIQTEIDNTSNQIKNEIAKSEKLTLAIRKFEPTMSNEEKQKITKNNEAINRLKQACKKIIKTSEDKIARLKKRIASLSEQDLKKAENFKPEISEILGKIKELVESKNFIPETAESILWAFFEDKFTAQDRQKAQENLDACLNQITANINKEIYNKKKLYSADEFKKDEFKKFEEEIKEINSLKKGSKEKSKNIIDKITNEYDRSIYSSIKIANIKIVPTAVNSPQMSFWLNSDEKKKSTPFATCFESAILDALSILLYDPKSKTYDLQMLAENKTPSNFFDTVINKVFKDKAENPDLINPTNINTKFQNWINIIENKNEYAIEYHDQGQIDGEKVGYNLNTRIENLIKILNEFYGLGLEIEYNQKDPKTLEIKNFYKIIEKPTDAKDFWNKIFEFISKKLSTDDSEQKSGQNRAITFKCELDKESKPELKIISEDEISISDSCGTINVNIKYSNSEYMKFNVDFDLNIQSGHAFVECQIRKSLGLTIYEYDFKTFLSQKVYTEKENQTLLPLFILLTDLITLEKTDIKMQNLLFYCMALKTDENKFKFIKTITRKGLFEDKSFRPAIKSFIAKILENEDLTLQLIDEILIIEKPNQIIGEIIDALPNFGKFIYYLNKKNINEAKKYMNIKEEQIQNPAISKKIFLSLYFGKNTLNDQTFFELISKLKIPEDFILEIINNTIFDRPIANYLNEAKINDNFIKIAEKLLKSERNVSEINKLLAQKLQTFFDNNDYLNEKNNIIYSLLQSTKNDNDPNINTLILNNINIIPIDTNLIIEILKSSKNSKLIIEKISNENIENFKPDAQEISYILNQIIISKKDIPKLNEIILTKILSINIDDDYYFRNILNLIKKQPDNNKYSEKEKEEIRNFVKSSSEIQAIVKTIEEKLLEK